jgi:hypothetical protein
MHSLDVRHGGHDAPLAGYIQGPGKPITEFVDVLAKGIAANGIAANGLSTGMEISIKPGELTVDIQPLGHAL